MFEFKKKKKKELRVRDSRTQGQAGSTQQQDQMRGWQGLFALERTRECPRNHEPAVSPAPPLASPKYCPP